MSDLVPGGDDRDAGLTPDVGVSLHEWTTRWEQIADDRRDSPGEALEEAADLLGDMLAQLEVPTEGAEAAGTEDLVRGYHEVREVVARRRRDERITAEELDDAWREAGETFEFLAGGRRED